MEKLIHLYAICPKALITDQLSHYLSRKRGCFLDPFPLSKKNKATSCWLDKPLNELELTQLKNILAKLMTEGAIRQVIPTKHLSQSDKKNMVISEISRADSKLRYAIVVDDSPMVNTEQNIVSVSHYRDNGLFDLEPVDLPSSPNALLEHLPDFVITDAQHVRLVDPYIFNVKTTAELIDNMSTVQAIVEKFYADPMNEREQLHFDIYGRQYIESEALRLKLLDALDDLYTHANVHLNFFILDRVARPESELPHKIRKFAGKKVHERFLCFDDIYFSFEDSSADRSRREEIQTWRLETSKTKRSFIECYNEMPALFKVIDKFSSTQLRFTVQSSS